MRLICEVDMSTQEYTGVHETHVSGRHEYIGVHETPMSDICPRCSLSG